MAWWGAGVSVFWHNYVDSEAGATTDVPAAVCALVLMSICVGVHGSLSGAERHVCASSCWWYVCVSFLYLSVSPCAAVSLCFCLTPIRARYV